MKITKIAAALLIASAMIGGTANAQMYSATHATKIVLAGLSGGSLPETVTLLAPTISSGNSFTLTLPGDRGTTGYMLTTDASTGQLSWTNPATGITLGGDVNNAAGNNTINASNPGIGNRLAPALNTASDKSVNGDVVNYDATLQVGAVATHELGLDLGHTNIWSIVQQFNSGIDMHNSDVSNINHLSGNASNPITVNSNMDLGGKNMVGVALISNSANGITIDDNADFNNHAVSNLGDVTLNSTAKISAVSGDVTINSELDMNNHKIVNVIDPTSNLDAANKQYVDNSSNTAVSGAVNTMAKFTGTHAVGNSSVTDDGTTFAINTDKFTVTEANGNTSIGGDVDVTNHSVNNINAIRGSGANNITLNSNVDANTKSIYNITDLTGNGGSININSNVDFEGHTLNNAAHINGGGTINMDNNTDFNNHSVSNLGNVTINSGSKITATSGDVVIDNVTDFNSHVVHGVNDPVAVKDAANKEYVDAAKAAITANNGLTRNGDEIDLGGTLQNNTSIALGGNNLSITGTGDVTIGQFSTGTVHSNGSGKLTSSLIVDGDITAGTITNTSIHDATIANSKLVNDHINFTSPNTSLTVDASTALGGTESMVLNTGHANGWTATQTFGQVVLTTAADQPISDGGTLDVSPQRSVFQIHSTGNITLGGLSVDVDGRTVTVVNVGSSFIKLTNNASFALTDDVYMGPAATVNFVAFGGKWTIASGF